MRALLKLQVILYVATIFYLAFYGQTEEILWAVLPW